MPENEENNSPAGTMEESLEEAAEQHLNKESKLEIAMQAVTVGQCADIADDEIDTLRQYREKKLGIKPPGEGKGKKMATVLVCDNVTVNEKDKEKEAKPQVNGGLIRKLLPWVVAGTLGGGVATGGLLLVDRFLNRGTPAVQPAPGIDTDTWPDTLEGGVR